MANLLSMLSTRDVIVVVVVISTLVAIRLKERRSLLPPGPKRLPLLGNLLDMPTEQEWLTFAKWGEIWGDIVSVSIPGQTIIILNSSTAAIELLDKKSGIYSDRPRIPMTELCGWNQALGLLPYGERFRAQRRHFQNLFGTNASAERFFKIKERETWRFLETVLDDPHELQSHISRLASSIILQITHGYEVQGMDDPLMTLANETIHNFSLAATPGGFLVNTVPLLRYLPEWFPRAGFKKTARIWKETLHEAVERPHAYVKKQMASGTAAPSFSSTLLEKENLTEDEDIDIKWASLAIITGASDTTVAAIHAFYKVLAMEPEVQRKAQAEIDSVIGSDRLPTIADKQDLPYVSAVVSELHRWFTVAPIGVPHCTTEADVYRGYHIPRGSLVIANSWQMAHDPHAYKDPMRFTPERFIKSEGHLPEKDPRETCFGFGRRICPGRLMADASVFIACAITLAVFNVSQCSEDGIKEVLSTSQTSGIISHPTPFRCAIEPRSAKAAALIHFEE